jgi:hypothetical protein
MKRLFTLLPFIAILLACSKSNNSNEDKKRTLQIQVKDHQPPTVLNHYWGVFLTFNQPVTLTGSVKVDYDVYNLSAFYKHYSYKITFGLDNKSEYIYNTNVASAPAGQGWETRNLSIDSLQATGDYIIELK